MRQHFDILFLLKIDSMTVLKILYILAELFSMAIHDENHLTENSTVSCWTRHGYYQLIL
jgi:hypothetical protein